MQYDQNSGRKLWRQIGRHALQRGYSPCRCTNDNDIASAARQVELIFHQHNTLVAPRFGANYVATSLALQIAAGL
jgi:hypothetical protein